MDVGERIKKIREKRKISIEELSDYAELSTSYLYQIERGDKQPSFTALDRICTILNIPIAKILEEGSDTNMDYKTSIENTRYRLKKTRKEKGLSTYQLAKIITDNGFKISQSAISKIENGRKKIDIETLEEIAKALEVTPNELLGLSTNSIDLSWISTPKLIEELNSRDDFPIEIQWKVGE